MRCFLVASVLLASTVAWADETPSPVAAPGPGSGGYVAKPLAPGRYEIRLEPTGFAPLGATFGSGGLSVVKPEAGTGYTFFGLNAGLGYLITPLAEPGISVDLAIADTGNSTLTLFGFSVFFKLNFWLRRTLNLFLEPSAGLLYAKAGNTSDSLFRGGLRVGIEYLFGGKWGLALWTGLGVLAKDHYLLEIPFRWGFVGYL